MSSSYTESQDIELVVPGAPRYVPLARLLAGGVATMYGLTLVKVRDTRLVLDEMCTSLMEIGQGCPVTVTISVADGRMGVVGSYRGESDTRPG